MSNNNTELDELLKAIEEGKSGVILAIKNPSILAFCTTFNIKPGKFRVPTSLLYKLYRLWFKSYKKSNETMVSREAFSTGLNTEFTIKKELIGISLNKSNISAHLIYYLKKKNPVRKVDIAFAKPRRFEAFLKEYNLTSGDIQIHSDVIYYLFDLYCYKKKEDTIRKKEFIKVLKLYLDVNGLYVKVNSSIYKHITKEEIEEILNSKGKNEKQITQKRKGEPKKRK